MYLCESVQLAFVYTGASESVRECESGREKKRKWEVRSKSAETKIETKNL